ncbi:uncharacterized protein LOC143210682 [Lasioglossum baleicum]|uniref:uncharacterized protein LOC143210682 n=1 Tax=Lasioglossum baleicum TaxID=434251 RepID=UPI003FCE1B3A
MPGIYVRKTSWINWMQQRENLVLTVPGSYWLCHKHNIYKFIFTYHRTIRNLKHFDYGRELMKIIRRIIKNPPRQGQQFSTNNLLVTYNNTSWTRQDKIFAMTKFKERSAAAFSHAFVLTIKVLSFLESSEQAIKYAVTTCSDELLSWNNKELVHSFNNELPECRDQCDSSKEKVFEQKTDKQLDDNFTLNKMSKNSTNKELVNDRQKLKRSKATNEKSKRENSCTVSDKHSTLSTVEENRLISNQLEDSNIENKDCGNEGDKDIIQNNITEFDNNEIDFTNTDSANLPYQYLIEREIEDAKFGTTRKRKRQDASEKCSIASVDLVTDVSETEESDSSTKRKRGFDNITPRSSDITDLVMEGLMFTIRQGQGTVAVIEQKTKLELDEVLENSEKIETVKGEKCLRNSSLLGLENLITMIESPKKTEVKQKPQNIVIQENAEYQNTMKRMFNNVNYSFKDTYFNNTWLNKNNNNTNKNQNTEIHEEGIKLTENEDFQYEKENEQEEVEEEEEEEEEDIIPEVLQNSLFQTSVLSFEKVDQFEEAAVNKDLLMDDADIDTLFVKEHKLQHKDVINETKKKNGPIIISNEIIATSQIPLPLQKLLQNKLSTKLASVNSTNETKEEKIVDHRSQLLECRNVSCKVHPESQNSDCNMLESSQSLANPQTSVSSNNETMNEGASFLILENECKNSDVIRNRLEEREDQLQNQPVSVNKEEQLSSCKLQDVTQEFYQDILYLQRKKNLTNQHLKLRSRKKSVNTLQDTNTHNAHIEMLKFFHDITKGAKVVITRMSTKSIHSLIAKNS